MITRITGRLVELQAQAAILAAGPFEYEVLIPEFVRRQLQGSLDQEVSLKTVEYLEGNAAQGGKLVPRIIGFMSDAEREFFDAICSVDGVGVKKALRAMVRPVRDVATAIEEQDVKELSTLPGIGAAMAERIVAKLRRKMAKFALLIQRDLPPGQQDQTDLFQTTYEALVALGHSSPEARDLVEKVAATKKKFKEVDDVLMAIYDLRK
jgi:holliday junction DNA helicase RuvA